MLAAIIDDERRCTMSDIAEVQGMEELLKAEKLAKTLDCSVAAVRRWTLEGCPVVKISRLRRYKLAEMLRWLEQREAKRVI